MNGLKQVSLALAMAGVLASGVAQAALKDQGGGLIYDDVLDITWLKDANYAKTQFDATGGAQGDADGLMNWTSAKTWAANLVYHDTVRGVDYDDWRLPTALNQDGSGPCSTFGSSGNGCTNSEMGHMFYNNMGASTNSSILTGTNTANLALITNLQTNAYYWTGTALATNPDGASWFFSNKFGHQGQQAPSVEYYAWAVHPGDVAAVPEPETYAMLLAGLGLVSVVAKRRRRSFAAS